MRVGRDEHVPEDVRRLLDGLPGWFGIPEANDEYVAAAGRMETWTAREDGEVVGVVLLERHFPHAAEVHLMAVRHDLRGRGTGRALLAAIEEQERARGTRLLEVKTLGPSRPNAEYVQTREFYRAVGFLELEETALGRGQPVPGDGQAALKGRRSSARLRALHMPLDKASLGCMASGGFWSYTHSDDEAEFGRITDLARDIVRQFELLTGDSIDVFLDRDSIEWGNAWRDKIDGTLTNVAFFIPVITPRFFASAECRREMRKFIEEAERLGLTELIMPIKWINFAGLDDDPQLDELIAAAKKYQWEDWTELRFEERASEPYRRAIAKMAQRLADANAEAEMAIVPAVPTTPGLDDDSDDSPGLMDLIAEGEEVLPLWSSTIERAGALVAGIAPELSNAQDEMERADRRGQGFAGRMTAMRKLANRLDPVGDDMVTVGNEFAAQLTQVDAALRAIIELAALNEVEDRQGLDDFFESIRELATEADDGLGSIQEFLEQATPIERMSRDLRRPFGKLRKGLTAMHEGREIINDWVRLIDQLPESPTDGEDPVEED